MKKYIGIACIVIAIILAITVMYIDSPYSSRTRTFSPYTLLTSSFQTYKKQFINSDGRVVDYSQNSITTSEGQSYALLRSVWADDKSTFDLVWKFTKNDLQHTNGDHLFSWRWGKRSDGTYGTLPNGGSNSATDADEDIAFALILAGHRWGDQSYIDEADAIIPNIWKYETDIAVGKRYVIAGNWATSGNELDIDPSYFAPYEYRIFAKVDTQDDWTSLIVPGYQLLSDSGTAAFNTGHGVGLPPDWLTLQKDNGTIKVASIANADSNYSFDAMRVPFRIALDYFFNKDTTAKNYLLKNYTFLLDQYEKNNQLATNYTHDGNPINANENPNMYATSIGYFMIADPRVAQDIYENKILKLYSNDKDSFNANLGYYEQNWLWFGAAMYNNYLHIY